MSLKQTNAAKKSAVLSLAMLTMLSAGCANVGAAKVLSPDPCVVATDRQFEDLIKMVEAGDYPGVLEIVADYKVHCCEDDALAGRSTEACFGGGD